MKLNIHQVKEGLVAVSDELPNEGDIALWLKEKIWKDVRKTDNGWYLQ